MTTRSSPIHRAKQPAAQPTCSRSPLRRSPWPSDRKFPNLQRPDNHGHRQAASLRSRLGRPVCNRTKGPVNAERAGNAGKARRVLRARAECPERAAARPITSSHFFHNKPQQPPPQHTRTCVEIFCLHSDSGTGIEPEAEARAYLRVRVRTIVSEGNS